MLNISTLSGEHFLSINYNKNIPIDYKKMKLLFDTNIISEYYYILVNNNDYIYTNLYDIYEIKFNKNIILDDLNIIFLPYNKNNVEYIKKQSDIFYSDIIQIPLVDNFNFPDDKLKNDKLFILMAVNHSNKIYDKISDELKYDKQIIYNAALYDYECLQYIPYEYKNDKEFMIFYIKLRGSNIKYASDELKNNKELINIAINNDFSSRYVLEYLNDSYKDDEEFIKLILNKFPECFKFISNRLKNKKEIALLSVKKYSLNIVYVSDNLSLDYDIVYAAINDDPTLYHYIHKSFFNDKKFILLCLKNNINTNGYDEENYEYFLRDLNDEFKDDKEIVIACIKKSCKNIIYCSNRLKYNKEVILTAINNCYYKLYNDIREIDKIKNINKRIENIDIILKNTKLINDPDILNHVIKKINII